MTATQPTTTHAARSMGIVHSALRRDIARTRYALSTPYRGRRLAAVGAHLVWMIDFLHHHHHGEETVIFPAMRRTDPSLGALLDRMDADHEHIQEPMARLRAVGSELAAGADTPAAGLTALDALTDALLPHLAAEERETMPEGSRLFTPEQWDALEQDAWVKDVSSARMAAMGLWIIDGQTLDDERFFLRVVSPATARMLRITFGPGYALKRRRLWGGTPAASVGALSIDAFPASAGRN